ncbi:MAG: ParA family protein [Anaerolineales bacterium]|nr:ParA family protein [Anaerolineales bacterium]
MTWILSHPAHASKPRSNFLPVRTNYTTILQRAIQSSSPHDYIILDCPPALGAITRNALAAANLLLIPTQAEYFSAYALRNMMALIRRTREVDNPNLSYRILVTMLDRRNRTHRNIHEQLRATFGTGVFNTVIELDTKLRESPIAGQPITHYKTAARGSTQYRVLAQELSQRSKKRRLYRQIRRKCPLRLQRIRNPHIQPKPHPRR